MRHLQEMSEVLGGFLYVLSSYRGWGVFLVYFFGGFLGVSGVLHEEN